METSEPSRRVLVVDDEPAICTVLNEVLDREGYSCRSCTSGEEALSLLRQEPFDVVITDLYMPGISGMALLDQGMRVRPESAFLMATGESDARVGVEAMKHGAIDYLVKPFQIAALVASVRRARENKLKDIESRERDERFRSLAAKRSVQLRQALERIEQSQDETLDTLGVLLDARDNETAGHGQRVCLYTIEIAKAMRVPRGATREFARGALLHDIGKIGIPDDILLKPGKLTPEETALMRTHVKTGYELLRRLDRFKTPAEIVLTHHERYDGSGYPQ
ncbi:MAG: response regulator, partial [Terriglobia bacterium]